MSSFYSHSIFSVKNVGTSIMLIFNTLTLTRTHIIIIVVSKTGVKPYWFTGHNL